MSFPIETIEINNNKKYSQNDDELIFNKKEFALCVKQTQDKLHHLAFLTYIYMK